eukprot:3194216-Pyramimonas_sp.AAC.1
MGARARPIDDAVRARAGCVRQDCLVRKVFCWLGAAALEGDVELTAEGGREEPGLDQARRGWQ